MGTDNRVVKAWVGQVQDGGSQWGKKTQTNKGNICNNFNNKDLKKRKKRKKVLKSTWIYLPGVPKSTWIYYREWRLSVNNTSAGVLRRITTYITPRTPKASKSVLQSRSCIGYPLLTTNYLTFTSLTQHTRLPSSVHVECGSSFVGWFRLRDSHEVAVKLWAQTSPVLPEEEVLRAHWQSFWRAQCLSSRASAPAACVTSGRAVLFLPGEGSKRQRESHHQGGCNPFKAQCQEWHPSPLPCSIC